MGLHNPLLGVRARRAAQVQYGFMTSAGLHVDPVPRPSAGASGGHESGRRRARHGNPHCIKLRCSRLREEGCIIKYPCALILGY